MDVFRCFTLSEKKVLEERVYGEKNLKGLGTTAEFVCGKIKEVFFCIVEDIVYDYDGECLNSDE